MSASQFPHNNTHPLRMARCHPHALALNSTPTPHSTWWCDSVGGCLSGLTRGSAVPRAGVPRWGCTQEECNYDLCQRCLDAQEEAQENSSCSFVKVVHAHPHILQLTQQQVVGCNTIHRPCRSGGGCNGGSCCTRWWRCTRGCDFALCEPCLLAAISTSPLSDPLVIRPPATTVTSTAEAEGECPDEFCCPITHALMKDPVILPTSGESFERIAVSEWVRGKGTDPATRDPCKVSDLIPNRKLLFAIEMWQKRKVEEEMTARTTAAATKESEHPQISSSSSTTSGVTNVEDS